VQTNKGGLFVCRCRPPKIERYNNMPNKEQNIRDLFNFIEGPFSGWYVGITNDPEICLYNRHKVSRDNGKCKYCPCSSDDIAREIEQYFLNLGCDGGPGGGNETSRYVYVYKKTRTTVDE